MGEVCKVFLYKVLGYKITVREIKKEGCRWKTKAKTTATKLVTRPIKQSLN